MRSVDPGPSSRSPRDARRAGFALLALAITALVWLGWNLATEPSFVDEWAYIAQTYYGPLWWSGRWNDPAWLDYFALDLPPLPKYVFAAALDLAGQPLGNRSQAYRWQFVDIHSTFGGIDKLEPARWASVAFGALGCVSLAAIGGAAGRWRAGLLAGLLLLANPLYTTHARRAMSDVPSEACILASLAVGLLAWRLILERGVTFATTALTLTTGALGGLAVLAKLNGGLAFLVLGAWTVLALLLPQFPARRRAIAFASFLLAGLTGYAVFVIGNPSVTARPAAIDPQLQPLVNQSFLERTLTIIRHRVEVSRAAQSNPRLAHDALPTVGSRLAVGTIQGFGRFGPFGPRVDDSTRRFDLPQDWSALLWLPCVALGAIATAFAGAREVRDARAPVAWALLLYALVAFATVTLFLPMAWNRYMLPIQAPSALLAACGLIALYDRLVRPTSTPTTEAAS